MYRIPNIFELLNPTTRQSLGSGVINNDLADGIMDGGGMLSEGNRGEKSKQKLPSLDYKTPAEDVSASNIEVLQRMELSLEKMTEASHFGNNKTVNDAKTDMIPKAQIQDSQKIRPYRKIQSLRRREQCRRNQERYRKKQAQRAKELDATVKRLHDEILLLDLELARATSSPNPSMWEVVAEYFNLFRYGTDQSNYVWTGSGISPKAPDAQRQQAFLRSAMTSDVNLGDSCGVDALFDQWRSYSAYFDPLQLRLRRVSKVSDRFLWASATLSVTISEITIQNVFPHISAGHMSLKRQERLSCIKLALLNKRLILPYCLCFEWDDTRNRVVRILTTLDFFSPILHAVKSIEDAALVLQHARINLNGVIHNI